MVARSALSCTEHLTLDQVVARLAASPLVDGVALFGSHATDNSPPGQTNPVSDYDLLLLVTELPVRIFQMVTSVEGRMADVVLVESSTADELLTADEPPARGSFADHFVQKMQVAHILYDGSGRLGAIQKRVRDSAWPTRSAQPDTESELYRAWFWLSFSLLHLERMVQSEDPLHLAAVDMMFTAVVPGTWRAYFDVRQLSWQGEKAAIRYWLQHDPAYMEMVQQCLAVADRREKIELYRKMVEQTLQPVANPFGQGETAVVLMGDNPQDDVQIALDYWQTLFDL